MKKINSNKLVLSLLVASGMAFGTVGCAKKDSHDHEHEEAAKAGETKHEDHASEEKHDEHGEEAHDEKHHDEDHAKEEHHHDEDHDHDKVAHVGKHVHGEAELNIMVNDKQLVIELDSPAMNVFGFEHKPTTDEQKAVIEAKEAVLNNAKNLFAVNGGECELNNAKVHIPFDEHDADHHHDEKEAAKDSKEHDHAAEEVHTDIEAAYTYNCKKAAEIKGIDVVLFDQFTNFNQLNTAWVVADKQGSQKLTKTEHSIKF